MDISKTFRFFPANPKVFHLLISLITVREHAVAISVSKFKKIIFDDSEVKRAPCGVVCRKQQNSQNGARQAASTVAQMHTAHGNAATAPCLICDK